MIETPLTKICSTCPLGQNVKPLSAFHKKSGRPGRYESRCKNCRKQARKILWQRHPASRVLNAVHAKAWYHNHLEQSRAASRKSVHKWRLAHPEEAKQTDKRYYLTHRERFFLARDKRRALKKGATIVEKVIRSIVFQRDKWICHLCLTPINNALKWPHPQSASVDHIIPLSLGGDESYANCAAAHLRCNLKKQAKAVKEQLRLF